jgi:hypothetical protein
LVFALLGLLTVGLFFRRLIWRRPAAPVAAAEVQELRQQLEEAGRAAALREELVLAEYDMKVRSWEAEGYDVREVRALLDQHRGNSATTPAATGRPVQRQSGRPDGQD